MKSKTIVCVPFTGLGLYGGFRGNRWLRNRIEIFKKFVIPSLQAQTDQNFALWIAWREEEKDNKYVQELDSWLNLNYDSISGLHTHIFTYTGIPFWDDKYSDEVAHERLFQTLHRGLPDLFDVLSDCEQVYWLLQPSDDLYHRRTIESVKLAFENKEIQAVSYEKGYICNYNTKEVLEYNPNTNPPFFAINFPRETFFDAGKHINYTGPYKSHEYIGNKLKLGKFEGRGFMVGTHGENISTHFNHPFGGARAPDSILEEFGVNEVTPLELPISARKWIMRRLPYRWQRKLRYIFGELLYSRFYNWIRS